MNPKPLIFIRNAAGLAGCVGMVFALTGVPCVPHTVGFAAAWGIVGALVTR